LEISITVYVLTEQLRSRWPSNYFGGSVVGKASTNWYRDLAHHSANFHRGSKCVKFGIVFNISQLLATHV